MSEVFKISLPGKSYKSHNTDDFVVDSNFANPKIDMTKNPPHFAIINLNWQSSISIAFGVQKLIYSIPHGYNTIPTAFAAFTFTASQVINGVLPFQYGALGMLTIDTDDKNMNIKYISFDLGTTIIPPFTMQIRYYLMAEHGYE